MNDSAPGQVPANPPLQADLLDNTSETVTHAQWLSAWVADTDDGYPLAVATGFINLGGLDLLATAVTDGRRVRILLGAEPPQGLDGRPLTDLFEAQRQLLGAERDFSRFPPSRSAERLRRVDEWLSGEEVEVRRYTRQFLHGKAYLFGTTDRTRVHAVTSANLTYAGLNANLELGAVRQDAGPTSEAIRWFERYWAEADDYKAELRELLFPEIGLVDPRVVYLRALAEYIGDLDEPEQGRYEIYNGLTEFQRNGYRRAREIIDRHGGVIYADGVGTGKTEIGLSLVEHYCYDRGNYALIVAPAQLVDNWRKRVVKAKLPAQVVSFNDLIADEQLTDDGTGKQVLSVSKDAYRLIVIDEAHALRNPDTKWHRAVARLAGGGEKHLALLTATPINNGMSDLLHLVMLFARHDRAFSAYGIDSLTELFKQADGDLHDPESIDPDKLFPLVELTVVRRDRRFIEKHYPDAHFPDGTPVRFPQPLLSTPRYSLDDAHRGIVRTVASGIDSLRLARYTPSAYLLEPDPRLAQVENQLAGLLRSGVLKRFESCWHSCLVTVERMIDAHDIFLKLWDEQGVALFGDALGDAVKVESDQASLTAVIEAKLEDEDHAYRKEQLKPEYRDAVVADRDRLVHIRDELKQITPQDDVKLALLKDLIEKSPAKKIAVFSSFADTVRYLDEQLPENFAGRDRIVVFGSESSPDERSRALARFAPDSVVEPGYMPPEGEVDLLLATDVLSEGQNLQQADCVISYDMPWNPQRVVQRNGRVIRLLSPHDTVTLATMLPEPGDLEQLLALEARILAKVRAASAIGMESQVIAEGAEPSPEETEILSGLQQLTEGLEKDGALAGESDPYSGAFIGEELRAFFEAMKTAGDVERVERLPWGIGAVARVAEGGRPRRPGIFFATRTKPLTDGSSEPREFRYWRYVELDPSSGEFSDEPVTDSERLEILRRINADELEQAEGTVSSDQLDAAWNVAAADIVRAHNGKFEGQAHGISVGPAQRWARDLIGRGSTPEAQTDPADDAYQALAVERSMAVRRALKAFRASHEAGDIGDSEAVAGIIAICGEYGLRKIDDLHASEVPAAIDEEDLAVVCWMAVGLDSINDGK